MGTAAAPFRIIGIGSQSNADRAGQFLAVVLLGIVVTKERSKTQPHTRINLIWASGPTSPVDENVYE